MRAELTEGFAEMSRPAWIAIAVSALIFVVAAVLRIVSVDLLARLRP